MNLTYFQGNVIMLNGEIVFSIFESVTRQLFNTKEECYVFYKDTKVLYKVKFDSYVALGIKLTNAVEIYLKYG